MYDSAGEYYGAMAVTDKGDFPLNTPHPMCLESKQALRKKAEQLWDEDIVVTNTNSGRRAYIHDCSIQLARRVLPQR